jgi:hypothetical protein
MARPTDALITGFVKSPVLLEASLAPVRRLRQEGILRSIHCVTWDSAELDPFVAPLAAMDDVRLTRVTQPNAQGSPGRRGLAYQIENLKAGLELLDGDGLVLKLRPDFVADANLLRDKIVHFDALCAPVSRRAPNGVTMPEPVLANKMWIPWADSNQPFFFEDAAFLAAAADARKLVSRLMPEDGPILDDAIWGSYAHVVRYGRIFAGAWPIFANYLKYYRAFITDMDYRRKLVPLLVADGFFWHLVVAHAWILHSQFHVDAGAQGAVQFYANNCNKDADWSKPESLRTANPYDNIAMWRDGTHAGGALLNVSRAFGRLINDDWQRALLSGPLSDFPADTLRTLMENIAAYRDGRLADIERIFYGKLMRFRRANWPADDCAALDGAA